uniref:Cullin-2 n=1 Tax=Haemonchus contortus TaxID=6289 RepID=A0A7I4YBJ8_HAECO|nr:Cullin and Cullin protein domain containing protein [Haemonchus contortus]
MAAYALGPKSVDFDKVWGNLQPSVIEIMNLHPMTKKDWDDKFHDVYDICVAIPEPLSSRLYTSMKKCIEMHVTSLYEKVANVPSDELLNQYYSMWKIYYKGANYVHRLFGYLNNQFVKSKRSVEGDAVASYATFLQKPDVKEIGCLAMDIWKERLIEPILDKLVNLLLAAIGQDRLGNVPPNKDVIAGVISSFLQIEEFEYSPSEPVALGVKINYREPPREFYQEAFESRFLASTEEYYSGLAQKLLADMTCSKYMEAVIEALEAEERRSATYVSQSSVSKVIRLCQDVMINAHKDKLHAVCHELITNEERKDLRNMYRLLKPIPSGLLVMAKEFEDYVRKKGLDLISTISGDNVPQQFVDNVLKVHEKFHAMKTEVFMDDGDFAGALDKALQSVVNVKEGSGPPRASERLARYTDNLLRKSAKGMSELEVDQQLSKAIVIFRYIEDKDVFQKYYSKMLASRLIMGFSVAMDAEEAMINKLKQACGYEFTSKLSRMFTDIGLSNELADKFNKHLDKTHTSVHVSMQPLVLQAGSWPLSAPQAGSANGNSETASFILPPILQPSVEAFEEYYIGAHNGRKLTWLFNMSHGELRLTYLDKPYLISMSVHQMSVLLCFQTKDSVKLSVISLATGITGDALLRNIRSIVDANILTASTKELTDSSELVLNKSLTCKRLRFRLATPQVVKNAEKEAESVSNTVTHDRKYYMECAIVRIMKTRKVLKHNALISEVVEQTRSRFTPDVAFIKKSIEDLIEKLYIQRTDQNDEYQYLA